MGYTHSVLGCLNRVRGRNVVAFITPLVAVVFLIGAALPAVAAPTPVTGPVLEIEAFFDSFFTRFADLTRARRGANQAKAMIPLLRHTKAKYDRSPATRAVERPVDPAMGLISKLWMHGPKSWKITEIEVTQDSAFAKVYFRSVDEARPDPIPFGFKFLKDRKNWKIGGYVDLRSVIDETGNWHDLIVTGNSVGPEAVFAAYMDKIKHYYTPKKAKESMQLAPQVQESLSPLWLPTEDATK